MKTTNVMKSAAALLASAVALAAPAATCAADGGEREGGVATFYNFTYSGDDDVYKRVALDGGSAYYNPILPGWNSDPSICRVGDDYFMVTSTFAYYPGVPLFHSKDLVNWRQISYVLNRPGQLDLDGQGTSEGIFAPAISYNPHNKTFYMITTNVGKGNFYVKTKDPFGEWSDPVWLPDVHGIDPSIFFDDDGKAYIVNNDEPEGTPEYDGHRAIKVRELDTAADKTVGAERVLVDKGARLEDKPIWIEGPHLYKIRGEYYLMAAEGGTGDMHSEVVFRGGSPMGPFTPAEHNPILTQRHLPADRPDPVTCAGHADLVDTPEGDWYAVFLACRPNEGGFENLGRETFLMPVRWNAEGWPYITQGDETVPLTGKVEGAVRGENVTFGNFTFADDFDGGRLTLDWMSLRGPVDSLCSLTDNPGRLTLKCADVSLSEKRVPAFVARRVSHHRFECETKMVFAPGKAGDKAGLALYKDETHQYLLCAVMTAKGMEIQTARVGADGREETIACAGIRQADAPLRLKIVSHGLYFDFLYAEAEGDWRKLAGGLDAGYLSTRNAWGFTGTTVGMYATGKTF